MGNSTTDRQTDKYSDAVLHDINVFRRWVQETPQDGIVFFGGAGVSTESGIPDFRSEDGLYSQTYDYPPETMVSHSFFEAHPKEFFDFYFDRMIATDARPNRAHRKLAELESEGKLSAVITQNIDGLHQAAGSTHVYELHGSVLRNFCTQCNTAYSLEDVLKLHADSTDGIPKCPACGGVIKPDVVLYEEPLDPHVMRQSVNAINKADMMIVAGTSLAVYPAAGLLDYFKGEHLVIINRTPTPQDNNADLCIPANVGDVFDF